MINEHEKLKIFGRNESAAPETCAPNDASNELLEHIARVYCDNKCEERYRLLRTLRIRCPYGVIDAASQNADDQTGSVEKTDLDKAQDKWQECRERVLAGKAPIPLFQIEKD